MADFAVQTLLKRLALVDLNFFIIFVFISSIIWAVAGGILVRILLRYLGFRTGKNWKDLSRQGRFFRCGVLLIWGSYPLALMWAYIEPYYPQLETTLLFSDKVTDTIRIVHISDTHCDPVRRAEDRVVSMVESLKPDIIAFTGDGVNSDEGIPQFKRLMRSLSGIAPLYGVRGNWEAWWFTHTDTFADTGIIELVNHPMPIRVRDQQLWIIGAPVDGEDSLGRRTRKLPRNAYRIVLHHFPEAIKRVDGAADLLLSGDTHGGQIALPLVGPLIRIHRWGGAFYSNGLHTTSKGTHLYVNRGIGMEGGHVPRIRFNVPPEVTLIEIHPDIAQP